MNRLRFGIVFCIAFGVCIIGAALWKTNSQDKAQHESRKSISQGRAASRYITFDNWRNGIFSSRGFYPRWVDGHQYSSLGENYAISLIDIEDESSSSLLDGSAWSSLDGPSNYYISADKQFVAITHGVTRGYAHYMTFFSVSIFDASNSMQVARLDNIQKVKWDPVGHKMAFVMNFDVYVMTNFSGNPTRVTFNGDERLTFNGITDWLYYVEITADDALLWWSPQGTYLAYASIDETDVKTFEFSRFEGKAYPDLISLPYPKPGTPIPHVTMYLYDPATNTSSDLTPSQEISDWGDSYLNSAIWRSNSVFSPTWKNRYENKAISDSCEDNSGTWTCSHVSEMVSESTTGWLGHYKPADLVATPLSYEYMTVLSDNTGFLHLVVVDAVNNTKNWRTSGNFEVTDTGSGDQSIFHYDSVNDWVYFTSTELPSGDEGLPRIRHMWRVKGHGDDKTRECITCALNIAFADRCNWVTPSFSPDGTFVVVNCGGTANGVPVSTLHKIETNGTVGAAEVKEDNEDLKANLETYYFRSSEFGSIELPDLPGVDFYYHLHKPPNFDDTKKYPMLVQVYSGPSFQYVTDAWRNDWARGYIASSDLDVIVMTFDGRGTGFRGDEIMHKVYRQLGKLEPIDQIEAARQVSTKYDFIDNDRIAIWGRSYGGYATSRTIAEDVDGVFKCGISVAPVTDWMTYHTIYTERYMGSPDEDDNLAGYLDSTAIQKLENFGKHYFVLVHGTSDENVHFLNGARLSKALIEADVDFGAYFAGDETHSFNRYPNSNSHHYKLLTTHLKKCFGLE